MGHKEYVFGSYLLSYSHRPLVKVAYSTWHSECDNLEARADEGVCTYASQECLQGPETRIFDTVKVYHPCWEERFTYNCDHSAGDGCGPLRAKGCVQTKSDCKK